MSTGTSCDALTRATGRRRRRVVHLGLCAGASLLAGCQTPLPAGAPLGVVTHAVSDQDFRLTAPKLELARGIIIIRGWICRVDNSETLSPHRILVTGYDASHHRLFRREIGVTPLIARNDDVCTSYAAPLAGVLTPDEVEVRTIPYGAEAPP